MRSFKNGVIVTIASALVLVSIPAAAGVGSWSTPGDLSLAGRDAGASQVVVDSTSLATAVWTRNDGSHYVIQSSTSQNGGAWSTPVNVSLAGQSASSPQVTVSPSGLVSAVWYRFDGSQTIIQASTSQNGGAWSSPVNLSLAGRAAYDPQVTVSPTGLATAVWTRNDGSHYVIQSSTSQNGGAWSTPDNVSLAGGASYYPQVSVDSTGLATAVWARNDGSHFVIQSSTSQNGGAWSTPVNISLAGGNANAPQVTVSSTGLATAVWIRNDGSNNIIQSSTSQNGGAWSTPINLSLAGGNAYAPEVRVSTAGLATAVWTRNDGSNYVIQSSTSQNGGAWSTPVNVSLAGQSASSPQVTVSSTGLATAAWQWYDGSYNIIQSSTSQNGGAWSTPVNLSLTGGDADSPQVTVSSTGLVTLVWARNDGSNSIIQSSAFRESTPSAAPAASTTPTLATTGANVEWLMIAGLLAAIAGVSFLTVSRRKRTA
jgi:LPXTG-motif cell wall-anchored protein